MKIHHIYELFKVIILFKFYNKKPVFIFSLVTKGIGLWKIDSLGKRANEKLTLRTHTDKFVTKNFIATFKYVKSQFVKLFTLNLSSAYMFSRILITFVIAVIRFINWKRITLIESVRCCLSSWHRGACACSIVLLQHKAPKVAICRLAHRCLPKTNSWTRWAYLTHQTLCACERVCVCVTYNSWGL